jgi:hypothetical protein
LLNAEATFTALKVLQVGESITHEAVIVSEWALLYRPLEPIFEVAGNVTGLGAGKMLGKNVVDEELKRGFGLSIKEIEPFLRAGGDAAEMQFMECCHYLWKVDGVELIEPFILEVFNKLPEKSRCVLFQRILTIVYLAQDGERLSTPPE